MDIGKLAVDVLAAPPAKNQVIDLHGPAYTARQVAEKLGAALGKTLNVVNVPPGRLGRRDDPGRRAQPARRALAELYAALARARSAPWAIASSRARPRSTRPSRTSASKPRGGGEGADAGGGGEEAMLVGDLDAGAEPVDAPALGVGGLDEERRRDLEDWLARPATVAALETSQGVEGGLGGAALALPGRRQRGQGVGGGEGARGGGRLGELLGRPPGRAGDGGGVTDEGGQARADRGGVVRSGPPVGAPLAGLLLAWGDEAPGGGGRLGGPGARQRMAGEGGDLDVGSAPAVDWDLNRAAA